MELLKVTNLHTSFFTPAGEVKAVNGVSFSLEKGKVLGIVGESGSGKSVTAYSIMQILANPGKIVDGSIIYAGQELVGASKEEMSKIRGNKISIIFQDPMTS
ncbi:MAG: ABC transporter ATP-binding protein, partial [Clostridia bacterium]|nr:ABC transporter ATP-binding protein [Clostridia bacterium]